MPGSECHVGLCGIGPGDDKLGSGLAGHSIDQFVLRFREEMMCGFYRGGIIRRQFEQVTQLLVESLFAGANVSDLFQQFVEVIRASIRVLQAVAVQQIAFQQKLFQSGIGPLAELSATG